MRRRLSNWLPLLLLAAARADDDDEACSGTYTPVSYTHLTLPTILLV